MWNLTSRPNSSIRLWSHQTTNVVQEVYKEETNVVQVYKEETNDSSLMAPQIGVVSISSAPKPPKKRFLEAAAADQLQQERQENQMRNGEDNSALMQLAEMCVYYQKSSVGHRDRSWSPSRTWSRLASSGSADASPTVYTARMAAELSPRPATTPFWVWPSRPSSEQNVDVQEDGENEEPLDLSGEETISTNQQQLIDHLVEKLCARPHSASSVLKYSASALVQPKLSLLNASSTSSPEGQQSSSEVTSSKDSPSTAAKPSSVNGNTEVRRDLPLKKRDSASLQQTLDQCDSTATEPASTEPVTSTNSNSNSKKPAPRSCKGKRYLEFMYEGRISSMGRLRRAESDEHQLPDQQSSRNCDQSGTGRKRQRPVRNHAEHNHPASGKAAALSTRGRGNKSRKLS